MGRAPCCDKANVKKGPWSPEEDAKLKEYIDTYGTGGNWIALPQKAGLRRCGKSCRLRWLNYLRPNIKHGEFTDDEDKIICSLFANIGSRWSIIAAQLPGRTDNDIKNYWNTKLKKKLMGLLMYPSSLKKPHQINTYPSTSLTPSLPLSSSSYKYSNNSCTSYYTTTPAGWSLTKGFEIETMSSNPSMILNASCCSSDAGLEITQDGYVGPMPSYQVKDSTLITFGCDQQASCSSDDGSCNNNNQISQCKESYLYNGIDENLNSMLSNGGSVDGYSEKPNGFYGRETPLDYSLEEIKQLISTNICNNLNFFVDDENKREEKVSMHY